MAQGEFALVKELLPKAIDKASVLVADPDLYTMLADAAVQEREQAALQEYAPLLELSATPIEHNLHLATAHRARGVLHRLEGDYKQAEARLEQAATLFRGLDTRWQLGRTLFELGEQAAETTELTKAKQHYANALALFEEMGAVPDVARAQAALSALKS